MSLCVERGDDFLRALAEIDQQEIARRSGNSGRRARARPRSSSRRPGAHFAHRARDEGAVLHGGFRGGERRHIHRIWRLRLAHDGGEFAIHEDAAEAQAGEAGRLRKRARHDQIPVAANPGNHRDAGKFEIGFVDHDHRARRGVQNAAQLAARKQIAGGAVRIRQKEDARRRAQARPALPSTEMSSRSRSAARRFARPPAPNRSGTSRRSARPAERVSPGSTNVFTTRLQRFVRAVGQQKLVRAQRRNGARPCGARFPARDRRKSMRRLSFASARRTAGEQPMGFSLKSRRSFSVRPSSGGL